MRAWLVALCLTTSASVAIGGQPTKRPSDEERGRVLYERHCWQCHGERNRGDGPATSALVHRVPNLSGQTKVDEDSTTLVLRGKSAMPAFEASFDTADARRVVKFMASLGDDKSLSGSKPKPAKKTEPAKTTEPTKKTGPASAEAPSAPEAPEAASEEGPASE